MTNKSPQKLNQEILNGLQSNHLELISAAISKLGETGSSAYLPALFELLHRTTSDEIKKQIAHMLSELKYRDAVPMLMDAIQNKQYAGELQYLVSACWENGLDYSDYLPVFISLVIERDFMIAFEAHTVITNMTGKISKATCEQECKRIKEAMLAAETNKKQLLLDLLDFLPVLQEGIAPQQY